MPNPFATFQPGLESPAFVSIEITPNDGADLPNDVRAIWIGVAGQLRITCFDGTDVVFVNVPVGWFPHYARRVWSTGTTAAAMLGVTK